MENIRQFMNEMKNYLIANGDVKYDKEVIKAKSKGPKTFDLDEILENVVCELVLIPLKEHLDDLIFREFSPSVTLVMEVMYHVRESSLHEVGVKAPLRPFSEEELAIIRNDLYKIQTSDLPSEKLKYFLAAVSSIFKFTKSYISGRKVDICTDDFIPLLIWVLSQCRTFTVEVEALYMCYLLNPSIMLGESGYYTRSLLSAGALLNETNKIFRNSATDVDSCQCSNRIEESSKEIKMVIIDQLNGLPLNVKTIRLKPNTKAKDICSVMARKLHVKHPEFFGLFMVVDGKAKILNDNFRLETIQESVQRDLRSKNCFFIYKEINKKLAWPFSNY
ncbi:protein sprint-like isoform X2 [Lycorma delicatula]